MRLVQVRLRNFRGYKDETLVNLEDLTVLIGRNDSGKSTIMDALDIFFNDGVPDRHDACKSGDAADVAIIGVFDDLPEQLVLDQTAYTSLQSEFLVNSQGRLEIHKVFNGKLEKPKLTNLFLRCHHPTTKSVADLLHLANAELKAAAEKLGVNTNGVDKKVNADLRHVIRETVGDLQLAETDLSLVIGNGVNVWKGIQACLPMYQLFRSDRASTDQDAEAQDPMKEAIKEALKQKESELNQLTEFIESAVKKIADLTLAKLREMDATLAQTLTPTFAKPNWGSLFKASITGDDEIPINKRGSGVRRLILLNFFRAKAEQHMLEDSKTNVIIAVEEPETSQHPRNQRLLMAALSSLSTSHQVIVTTHTPVLAKTVPLSSLRFITKLDKGDHVVLEGGGDQTNQLIATSLGVLPDHTVKLFICIEGKYDIALLKNLSRLLVASGEDVPDLEQAELAGEVIFTPLGGSALVLWANRLKELRRPEFHLCDRDIAPPNDPKQKAYIDLVNARDGCYATSTQRREAENYLHMDAINQALVDAQIGVQIPAQYADFDDVPKLLTAAVNAGMPQHDKWNQNRAKDFLCNAVAQRMTKPMLDALDPTGEVVGWFKQMKAMMATLE